MRWKTGVVGISAVVLSVATMVDAGALTATFTEVEPPIPDGLVFGSDINDAGQVVGRADFAGGSHGFVRAPDGTYTELLALAGESFSGASAINNDGDVVGASGGTAVVWEAGSDTPTDLGSLPGETFSSAVDISDGGWIVGNGSDTGMAWYIDPGVGTMTAITPVPGTTVTQVRAVNDAGVAVGRVYDGSVFEPFTWNVDDGMTILPAPPGETEAFEPTEINDAGVITGHAFEFIAPSGIYRAWVLDPVDGYVQLTIDGFDSALPLGLSDTGWVVGFVEDNGDGRVPAAWNLDSGDATAFALFNDAAFTNEINAVNATGGAVGISREGDDFERTYVGQIGPDPGPTPTTDPPPPGETTTIPTGPAPAAPAARAVTANPTFTG